MEKDSRYKEILLADNLDLSVAGGQVVHVFVQKGRFSFQMRGRNFVAEQGDYAILVEPLLCKNVTVSNDFEAIIVHVSNKFTLDNLIDNNLNVKSLMILLLHPVLKLTEDDRRLCTEDLRLLAERIHQTGHQLQRQVVEMVMAVHTLDLHNIIMQQSEYEGLSDRTAQIITRFMELLHSGSYRKHRDLHYYAAALYVADNYLTQLCREASGHSATYWINLFTAGEISFLLHHSPMSLSDIAHRFGFSSMSYFSRYVFRMLGSTPSQLRGTLRKA